MNLDSNFQPIFKQELVLMGDTERPFTPPVKSEIVLPCNCGQEMLKVIKWSDEDEYYLQWFVSYNPNRSLWRRIIDAIKNKEQLRFETTLSSEEFKKLKQWQ